MKRPDANDVLRTQGADALRARSDAAAKWTTIDGHNQEKSNTKAGKAIARLLHFKSFADVGLSTSARYMVKDILPAAGLAVVWGPPKCGKSFFVFDMMCHVALGWTYREHRVRQGTVTYFALEGQLGFEARIAAFRQEHGVTEVPFHLSTDRIALPQDGEAVVDSIQRAFPDLRPAIVVLDTLNRSISGSENDPSDMGAYIRTADAIREAFDCLVIVIHHCGVEGARPRGHTSLTGAADAQIAVRRDGNKNVVATVEYLKDGAEGTEIVSFLEHLTVGMSDDGDPITSCVVRASTMKASADNRLPPQAKLALRILQETIAESTEAAPASVLTRTRAQTCRAQRWRENWYAKTASSGQPQTSRQKAFVRALERLEAAQLIGTWEDFVWLA